MSTIFNKNKIQKTIESLKKTLNTQKTIKSPNATSIAQGTIEYLVIIAVVIVIALVVVALILNMTDYDQVQIMSNKNQNLIGKGGISIIDSAINSSGEGVILFQNTLGESLTIKSITPGAESSCEKMLSSGTKYSCYLTNIDSVCPCNAKERVICDFKINFETKEGIQKSETFTIINDCTDQPITNPNNNLLINLISPNSGTIVTSLDSNTNFNFRANKVTTDCNLYIKTNSTWNFAENRNATTARNTLITIDANVASFGTNVNSWKIKCTDEENNTGESIDRSITYSPETPPTTYTVTFDSQGGSSIDPISGIQSGATITLPTNPTKTGYTFVEWNTQANGLGTEFTASTQVTQNIIIYAQWEEEQTPAFFESCWRETAPHTICNCFDLNKMRENNEWNYILQKDINMNATECAIFQTGPGFEPMGWMGQFDGNNKKIIGLYINRPTMDYVGLAGAFLSVKNLTMEEVDITGRNYVGGIAGFSTDMNNCSTSGTVTGQNSVGGLIGRNEEYRSVTFTHSNATIIGVNNVGGIIGKSSNDNPIKNSYFSGTINATGDKVGGIVGEIGHNDDRNMINNCYFNGTITGVNHVGGLVGYLFYADVSNSYTLGNIEGQVNVGGISGITWASSIIDSNSSSTIIGQENVGGITGRQDGTYDNDPSGISHLIRCNSSGNITAGAYMVGGLVGNMYGDINESYSTATITGDGACGGLAGGNFENNYPEGVIEISINNSYYISNSINCNATSGGLVGFYENEIPLIKNSYSSTNITGTDNWSIIPDEYGDASITNSYYDSTKFSGEYTNGTGLTTSQMKQSTNFSGWDFSTIWNITNGTTYPYLRNNTQSPLPQ